MKEWVGEWKSGMWPDNNKISTVVGYASYQTKDMNMLLQCNKLDKWVLASQSQHIISKAEISKPVKKSTKSIEMIPLVA